MSFFDDEENAPISVSEVNINSFPIVRHGYTNSAVSDIRNEFEVRKFLNFSIVGER